jgi:cob(I)alamin adenosyltransferase
MPSSARPLRIGLSGAPGVGKTTLARALGDALGIPVIAEEMRAYLERTGPPLGALPAEAAGQVLQQLWRERAAREQATAAFVADNSCLDFAAYGVYYDCLAEAAPDDPEEPVLLREPRAHLAAYDAIFVLPCGVLPYERDGVRPASRSAQLRHHLIIDGMLRRWADPRKVHHVPDACTALADRVAWVQARLAPAARRAAVYLVGAGPGDPGLLTVRARELLATADVIAHDALVPPAILALARRGAELVAVGRRHGDGPTSYRLHPAVIERAAAGLSVVRLKAGDPLIFGRGGEEAEELREAGLAFEIVPGVSAALGAAAYAGIPLTHRDHASDVTFATGHDVGGTHPSHTDWASLAQRTGTLVLYMASRTLGANLARLVAGGRDPATPAAYVAAATTPQQHVITGTLATLAELATSADPVAPALVVIGSVVGLRDRLAWFAPGPVAPLPAVAAGEATAAAPSVRGLLVVYTGQGKGKTTAALGIVFRALGRGMRVAVVQFIKGKWKTGERLFAETLPGLTFLVMGKGFTWNSDDLDRDRTAAQAAWQTAKQLIASGDHAIVVVDEITYAINYGFIELDDVVAALRTRPPHVHVVATGRNAPEALCELADLVTDMVPIKHPFTQGVKAQLGIDY